MQLRDTVWRGFYVPFYLPVSMRRLTRPAARRHSWAGIGPAHDGAACVGFAVHAGRRVLLVDWAVYRRRRARALHTTRACA